MSPNTRDISQDNITRGVIKACTLLNKCNKKYPKIADILCYLNVDKILENVPHKKYRGIYNSYNSYLKLLLFMDLTLST